MALVVSLKTVEYLKGRYDRVVRITFRGKTLQSNIVHNAKRVAYFGQNFEWPIARAVEPTESLEILVFNYSKYLIDKLVGSYVLILQEVVQTGQLSLSESLVDRNNRVVPATISFDVYYASPGGEVGNWSHRISNLGSTGQQFGAEVEEDEEMLAEERAMVERLQQELEEKPESEKSFDELENASANFIMDNLSIDRNIHPTYVDLQLDRPKEFEVVVTIIEGQQLSGLDIDPVIKIEVGDQAKYTSIKQSTNTPYYNEYFVFNFNEMPAVFLDKLLTISAYHSYALPGRHILRSGNMVAAKRIIGSFRCDLGMIYTAPDHQFYHKWAVLLDTKDLDSGPKGYIKCDIAVTGRGKTLKIPRSIKESEDADSIEANLLLPQGVKSTRHKAVYALNIYKAEELPQTDVGIIASMQKALTNKDVAYIDACVRVSFAGQVGKTSVIKSYYPEWNECMKFLDMFPPLCSRFKIQLCDQDGLAVEPVATHFIELSQIMDPGGTQDGILPTFGPSWVNMYGSTRGFKFLKDGTENLNEGLGEGSAFRGRLLMSLRTSVDPTEMATEGSSKVILEKLRTGLSDHAPKKSFLLFASIFEASMVDAKLSKKSVQFEISIGQYGNIIDGRSTSKTPLPDIMGDDEEEEEDDGGTAGVPSLKQQLLRRQKNMETNLPCRSMTPRKVIQLINKDYGFLPFDDEKPCLFVVSLFEDIRKRLFHSNLLNKIAENLDDGLADLKERMTRSDPEAHRRFKGVMEKLKADCIVYLGSSMGVGAGSGKTKLDQYRLKSCKRYMEDLKRRADSLRMTTTANNLKDKLQSIQDVPYKLRIQARDPQHALPDVILWMLCDNERVAYYRFPAKDLFYHPDPHCVGKNCGKRQTIFLKKPGKKGHGQLGWMIQAKLNIFMWLGDLEPSIQRYIEGLPAGYEPIPHKDNPSLPPLSVVYSTWRGYQFRGYLFQARSLIPSDQTGLSDPFARILVCNRVATTQVVMESLSPTWDETIILESVVLYGDPDDIKASPPLVVVEVYDFDTLSQPEFLGRAIITPKFNLCREEYVHPKLEWCDLFRGPHKAGQLLASFEFIEGTEATLPPRPPVKVAGGKVLTNKEKQPLYSIPPTIKPPTSKHRLEILFRGVRELKRVQLLSVDHPHIMVDCSGQMRTSDRIVDMAKSCNFETYLKVIDLELPDERVFWPPLTIRCFETRSFGRSLLVGIHTADNIEEFVFKDHRNLEEIQRLLSEVVEDQTAPADVTSNGQPTTSLREDAQSRHTILSAKSAKSSKSQKTTHSATHPDGVSLPSGELSTVSMIQPTFFPADLLNAGVGLASEPPAKDADGAAKKTKPKKSKKDLESKSPAEQPSYEEQARERELRRAKILELDWWSKYFASKDDIDKVKKIMERNKDGNNEDADKENYGWNAPDYTVINMEDFGQHVEDLKKRALELERGKKKKKRKKLTRKRLKRKMKKLKGRLNEAFAGETFETEDEGVETGDESPVEDNSHIQRLMILPCGLEEVPEFSGFGKFFRTFQLCRGKKANDEKEESERFSGLFKGQFCIYKLEEEEETQVMPASALGDKVSSIPTTDEDRSKFRLGRYLPTHKKVEVKVLIYILKATDLHPLDLDGRADPYLIVRCGKHKVVDKENKIDNQLNPIFGRLIELDAVFPLDSIIKIEVWDYDSMSSDDLIGETTIDLEDRYFSHHMARCAIQQKYETFGYNTWRNPLKPSQLLELFCDQYGYPKPIFNPTEVKIGEYVSFRAEGDEEMYEETEQGDLRPTIEHLALKALKNWHKVPGGWPLVPEHVESRPLFCDARPGIEQGHLEMWIDMFPKDSPKLPASIDISPRIPKSYELRCIVWNTDEVVLDDVNFFTGEASSDIFVKGFIKGVGVDDMKTDIHYRSLTGEGNFNWRFIFQFDYLKAENKVVYRRKDHVLATDEVERRTPPLLSVQVWDADIVTADDFLGSIVLNLLNVPRPAKSVKKCNLKMIEDESYPRINLFKNKRCKGWWPVTAREKPDKDDDDDESNDDEDDMERLILKGKVEMELELLTQEEADKNPVGSAHEEPEALPKPNRPDTSFLWFMNPLKTLKYIIWKNYKWLIIKLIILLIIIIFLVLFFYNFPGAFVNRIMQTKG